MNRFGYARPGTIADAARILAQPGAKAVAGGTNLVDLMKEGAETPTILVDLKRLPLDEIRETEGGGLSLGALVPNSTTAWDERVEARFPLLARAILAGASPQLRNAATNGGNLNQRTRCYYFYDVATACNKRAPGSGCGAIGGINRIHAILGASDQCIATHPSDMCVALAALDARVKLHGPDGERFVAFADYHRLPGDDPTRDTMLQPGEIVTAIDVDPFECGDHWTYLKLRDRLSYAFALVSVAAALRMEGERIVEARIALGGVAHKPWRVPEAEALLAGEAASPELFSHVADRLLQGAVGQGGNDFKIDLARRAIVRALGQAVAGTPQTIADKRIA
ncbi:FAD binding domain-containing protein [Sphingomonas sp.]|uniref:FAD binding domain-containing protein n=1 Tax=Sphingomonas sp. TaxID=28214 RepID=UPI003B002128